MRVSGEQVPAITQAITSRELIPRVVTYTHFYDLQGDPVDNGIAIFYRQPHSYTGEDVLELQGHGGPVVMDALLERVLELGARAARAGEFSERAFLNGKLDLAQAEAVADIIEASSKQAARLAQRSLQGHFSSHINQLCKELTELRAFRTGIDDEEICSKKGMSSVDETLNFLRRKREQIRLIPPGRIGTSPTREDNKGLLAFLSSHSR